MVACFASYIAVSEHVQCFIQKLHEERLALAHTLAGTQSSTRCSISCLVSKLRHECLLSQPNTAYPLPNVHAINNTSDVVLEITWYSFGDTCTQLAIENNTPIHRHKLFWFPMTYTAWPENWKFGILRSKITHPSINTSFIDSPLHTLHDQKIENSVFCDRK